MTSYANGRPQKVSRHFKSAMQRLVAFCCMSADSTTYVSKPTGHPCYPCKEFLSKTQHIYHVHIDRDVIMFQKEIFSQNMVFLTD